MFIRWRRLIVRLDSVKLSWINSERPTIENKHTHAHTQTGFNMSNVEPQEDSQKAVQQLKRLCQFCQRRETTRSSAGWNAASITTIYPPWLLTNAAVLLSSTEKSQQELTNNY